VAHDLTLTGGLLHCRILPNRTGSKDTDTSFEISHVVSNFRRLIEAKQISVIAKYLKLLKSGLRADKRYSAVIKFLG
jgi:hypothetical protein